MDAQLFLECQPWLAAMPNDTWPPPLVCSPHCAPAAAAAAAAPAAAEAVLDASTVSFHCLPDREPEAGQREVLEPAIVLRRAGSAARRKRKRDCQEEQLVSCRAVKIVHSG
jgi:hypothetical protein